MLSNILATNICSLVEQTNKFTIVCTLTIKDNIIIDSCFSNEAIFIHKNYTYDDPDLLSNPNYTLLFDTISSLAPIHNSHDLIEWIMIEMNFRASIILKEKNIGIFRNNNLVTSSYFLYHEHADFNHKMLNKSSYLHITSPIRRIVDILNQIALIYVLNLQILSTKSIDFYNTVSLTVNTIHYYSKKIKYLESDIYFLTHISNETSLECTAVVLDHSIYIDKFNKYMYVKDIHLTHHINTHINIKLYIFKDEITYQNKIKVTIL